MLSGLLALAVNEWRQRAADEALAAQALGELCSEFTSNRQAAAETADYRAALIALIVAGIVGLKLVGDA